ncbi:polysaccharide biosynthesis tyrosine autokinase [Hyphomicrobium sp.]|uniref:polysaccharide biosynthesis tyrosine autokinase n=1 Tax=Hyphomicrobium sp. TaxID=82 RepID=UPI0025C119CE|nr:polysaccharide biosynthesis tyrosine autokinase [Hyphomicrobium sp.]MCC7251274.1 polysaccharide biosynthesis tyrosine autokinase [Hyphomicrobium sp.]
MLHVPTDLARHAIEIRGQPLQTRWSLSDLIDVIRWRRKLIVWAVAAVVAPALVYVAVTPPAFTASAVLMTDTKRSPAYGSAGTPDSSVDMVVVESQNETLKSDRIALAVIDKLQLWADPEFVPDRPSLWTSIQRLFMGAAARRPKPTDVKRQIAVGNFKKGLQVERAGRSYVSVISFTSTDPAKSAGIANAIGEAYIVDQLSARLQIAQRSSDWVESRVSELNQRARETAKALADFKAASGVSSASVAGTNANMAQSMSALRLRELESAAQSARTTYETFLNRYTQSIQIQQQAFPVTEARVLAEAMPPLSKSTPKTALILVLAVVAGGTLGLIGAFAREYGERLVRSPRQLERELRVRVLGTLPKIKRPIFSRGGPLPVMEAHKSPALSSSKPRPLALAGESLRGIKVALERNASEQGRVIGITSPRAGTGKTTVAYNLALLSAQAGSRTLLIDADLRRSVLTRSLTQKGQLGFGALIAGHADISECIVEHRPFLHFLGETAAPGGAHPSEILGSAAMAATVDRLRKAYDYIFIDLPPLLDCVDVRASAPSIALFIVVTEWGRTPVEDLDRALASCDAVVERLLGVVVNKVAAAEFGRRH